MRPARFQDFAVELATNGGATSAVTLKEAGDTKHPFGLAAEVNGVQLRYQVIARGAPGETYDEPETPVEGDPVAPHVLTSQDGTLAERWLAGLLVASGCREIERIEVWSPRREAGQPGQDGLTVFFRNQSRIYARVLSGGHEPGER
jgi:hypothetical protein